MFSLKKILYCASQWPGYSCCNEGCTQCVISASRGHLHLETSCSHNLVMSLALISVPLLSAVEKSCGVGPTYLAKESAGKIHPDFTRYAAVGNTVKNFQLHLPSVGRDSSVVIATRYGLDDPGIESRWGRDFPHLSRPALGPTQPPI